MASGASKAAATVEPKGEWMQFEVVPSIGKPLALRVDEKAARQWLEAHGAKQACCLPFLFAASSIKLRNYKSCPDREKHKSEHAHLVTDLSDPHFVPAGWREVAAGFVHEGDRALF